MACTDKDHPFMAEVIKGHTVPKMQPVEQRNLTSRFSEWGGPGVPQMQLTLRQLANPRKT